MKQFFGKKKLAKLVTLSVMTGAMLGFASGAWADAQEKYTDPIAPAGEKVIVSGNKFLNVEIENTTQQVSGWISGINLSQPGFEVDIFQDLVPASDDGKVSIKGHQYGIYAELDTGVQGEGKKGGIVRIDGNMLHIEALATTSYDSGYAVFAVDGQVYLNQQNTEGIVEILSPYYGLGTSEATYMSNKNAHTSPRIDVDGSKVTVKVTKTDESYAVCSYANGVININQNNKNGDVEIYSPYCAVYAGKDGDVNIGGKNIQITGGIFAKGNTGTFGTEGGSISIKGETVNLTGESTFGEKFSDANRPAVVAAQGDVKSKIDIEAKTVNIVDKDLTGSWAHLIFAGQNAEVNVKADNINLEAEKKDSSVTKNTIAVRAYSNAYNGGTSAKVTLQGGKLSIKGADEGIRVQTVNSAEAIDDYSNKSQVIVETKETDINLTGEDSVGIVAMANGYVKIDSPKLSIDAKEVLVARGHSKIDILAGEGYETTLKGNINYDYEGNTSGSIVDATVNVNLTGDKSSWTGNSYVSWSNVTDANHNSDTFKGDYLSVNALSVTLADGAKWIPTYIVESDTSKQDAQKGTLWDGYRQIKINTLTMNKSIIDMSTEVTANNTKAVVENLTATDSEIKGAEGKNATLALYGNSSSLTNTNVTGVNIVANGGATLNIDGGTFTNTGFSGKNYSGYSFGANILFLGVSGGTIQNATFKNSSVPKGYDCAISAGTNSNVTLENLQFLNNSALSTGAASLYGVATVNNCLFDGNEATADDDDGAGALFLGSVSKSNITKSVFTENQSKAMAGAIGTREAENPLNSSDKRNNSGAALDITDTDFIGNKAATYGGAFDNFFYNSVGKPRSTNDTAPVSQDGYVYIKDSTFDGNSAADGGAIYNAGHSRSVSGDLYGNYARLYIENSTFTKNTATNKGGAIYNDEGAVLVLDNVTFKDNTAAGKSNDIYNAGDLTLNNVWLYGGVENAATGKIKVGEGTRVLVEDVGDESANLTGVYATNLWTMAGGTLVTSEIDTAVAGAEKFTMTSGVVEYGADYYLTDAIKWAGVVKDTYSGAFSLKLTGQKLQKDPLIQEVMALKDIKDLGLQVPDVDVEVDKDLLQEYTEDEKTKKQLVIGDKGSDKDVKKDVIVHNLDVGDADKIVISPAEDKKILVEINGAIIRNNEKTEKLDMDLKEGAGVKIISEDTLELGTLKALNNKSLTVTMEGNFVAEKFEVESGLDQGQVISFVVGGKGSENPSSLVLKDAKDTEKLEVFVDPVWASAIEHASSYSQDGNEVKARLIGGRNSLIVLGETDRTKAEQVFNDMEAGLKFGNTGDVNAVLYVAKPQTMAAGSKLYLDGRLTNKDDATENAQFYAAPKSLTMIAANICNKDTAAISGLTDAKVDDGAKLYIEGADAKTYKVLGVATGLAAAATVDGWQNVDILANSLVEVETTSDENGFSVTFKQATVDLSSTVAPNVGREMAKAEVGSPAREAMKEMLSDLYTDEQQAANVNAYANMGENLGVSRGAYDVANMVGNAVTEHWDNNAKGENIWAVYTHSKDKVDGMELGGMDAQFDAQYNGVVVGADLSKGFGIALNYTDGNVSNGFGGHNDAKYYGGSIYGRKVFGNWNLFGDLTYTHGKNELAQGGIEADAKTNTISAGLTAKYLNKAGKYSTIAPFAGVRYMHIDGKDYTDTLGVNREADKINSVVVPVGLEYTGEFKMNKSGWNWKPRLAVGYLFNLGDRENDMTMRYGGAQDVFGYDFVDSGAFFTHAGMDFENKNFTLGLSYDFMKSKNSKNNKWNVNANVAF